MLWHVTALAPTHPAQQFPPRHLLGTVHAADLDSALFVARIEYGDRLGLHVQSSLSAQIAADERAAVAQRRIRPQGYHAGRRKPKMPWEDE